VRVSFSETLLLVEELLVIYKNLISSQTQVAVDRRWVGQKRVCSSQSAWSYACSADIEVLSGSGLRHIGTPHGFQWWSHILDKRDSAYREARCVPLAVSWFGSPKKWEKTL
jgi:hypothetical protein